MTDAPLMSGLVNEDVHLPSGPIVRIRAPRPDDALAVERLAASPEATRTGAAGGGATSEHGSLVADFPWGGGIVGHAAWGRLPGPRAAVAITVARGFSRWPVAAHLLVRLARIADIELIPALVVSEPGDDDFERLVTAGFGARRAPDGSVEIPTCEWPAALASLEHRSAAFAVSDEVRPAAAATRAKQLRGPVVVVGGGVAALECVMALRDLGGPELRIQLIACDDAFVYRPLLVAEPFSLGTAARYPLSNIAADFDVELLTDAIVEVRAEERQAVCASGATIDYEALVLALGARPEPAFEHAITFGHDPTHAALHGLLADLEQGYVKNVGFVVPPETSWSLPLYELALITAREVREQGIDDAHLWLVTPEHRPLAIFGPHVSEAVGGLLEAAGVEFVGDAYADVHKGVIEVHPSGRTIEIDRVVALPALRGPALAGVPANDEGFIPTDEFGAVTGRAGVFAAGDATTYPVKQGGLAAQQADAVAQTVAARLGAPLEPRRFKPVLRGLLFTGGDDRFLRSGIGGGEGDGTTAMGALWWPPTKVAGLYLAPYLYERAGWAGQTPGAGFSEVELPLEHVT